MSWRSASCCTATLARCVEQQLRSWRSMSSIRAAGDAEAAPPAAGRRAAGSGRAGGKRQRLLAPLPPDKADNKPKAKGTGAITYLEPRPGRIVLPDGTELTYSADRVPAAEASALFATLHRELPWEQRSVRIMGRSLPQPRLVAYQADGPELSYTYSGATLAPAPWHPAVRRLKALAEAASGVRFNACLLNLYRWGCSGLRRHRFWGRRFPAARACCQALPAGGAACVPARPWLQSGWGPTCSCWPTAQERQRLDRVAQRQRAAVWRAARHW